MNRLIHARCHGKHRCWWVRAEFPFPFPRVGGFVDPSCKIGKQSLWLLRWQFGIWNINSLLKVLPKVFFLGGGHWYWIRPWFHIFRFYSRSKNRGKEKKKDKNKDETIEVRTSSEDDSSRKKKKKKKDSSPKRNYSPSPPPKSSEKKEKSESKSEQGEQHCCGAADYSIIVSVKCAGS